MVAYCCDFNSVGVAILGGLLLFACYGACGCLCVVAFILVLFCCLVAVLDLFAM